MKARAFNPQIFLESACFLLLGGCLLFLTGSGKYLSYVTPRMAPYLYFTAGVMLLWSLERLSRLFRPQHKIRCAHCFVLVLPVLLLMLPQKQLLSADLSSGYTGAFGQSFASEQKASVPEIPAPSAPADESEDTENGAARENQEELTQLNPDGLSGLDVENRKITVSNEEFYPWIAQIYVNLDKYEGYAISLTGFVFKDPEFMAENEFVTARLAMTCCAADLTPLGMVCMTDDAPSLSQDSWVTVEGVIHKGQYEGLDEPQITVTGITPAEEIEGYIYPY